MKLSMMTAGQQEGQESLSIYEISSLEGLGDLIRVLSQPDVEGKNRANTRLLELKLKDGDEEYFLRSGGYGKIVPEEEPTALELGAAVRAAGLAGGY